MNGEKWKRGTKREARNVVQGLRRGREGDCAQENSENDRNLAELVSEDVNDDFGTRRLIKQFVELENPSFSCMKSKCTQSRNICVTIIFCGI